ncbi:MULTISPECIES: SDR family NAD(P)-dependent oxidoreductase [Rhodobacterales]|jgi:NAD(P)-dependent dehydrogenase (short-subunit alcohol dehydrogenase family)|uniref:SDR family NAD(P)-dependent oxidoreductase n=1 Tax=Rhodobacterales TaxID=204455 RepID=UPI00237F2714|nr:SDR family NAD(P)-dependent oxidoreductase [Phaeobacter gallaeciensis]MDE4099596.1 SDR family NAD(P)-dependent oxidoreductase [Phaeobacter gallaeciensis]MDE4108415.1 SDR family NAD(P)-dependent oxidoreductase [Phaeobacter gallaeciensis]MDE4112861.1 SDR family NAD(P)-dependent oxidoreductase [Phaeobacter gallaeciensis]MDE4117250.1 SDR family NAD(P)-dependent oxidoreductase [Phaeobacter gallaeciensis]MDE4121723.1 SDR family NAD(P)-dependent oxidoreductase [Phaeobacter gallaeciensis]
MQKTILITGCSSGIGLDAARGMWDRGWRVFASCRQQQDCDRMRDEGFDSPLIDYTRPDTITDGLKQVLTATGGGLDVLFNNGAHGLPGAVEDLPTEALRDIFESNFFGWHELTRQVLPVMRAQGHGRIVQNSSILGLVTFPWRGAYVATKYAVEGLTDTLRIELTDTNIHVILIEPGPVTSKIRENSIPHFERYVDWRASPLRARYEESLLKRLYESKGPDRFELPASAVTAKLIHACESPRPRPRYYVTTPTHIAGFLRRVLPTRSIDRILARLR